MARRGAISRKGRTTRLQAMATEVIDADVVTTKSDSPSRGEPRSIIDDLNKVQKAFEKTRELVEDPDSVLNERKLPKAGVEKMEFEDEEYLKSVEEAKERVQKSFGSLDSKTVGEYLPLRYEPDVIRAFYDRRPLE